MPRAAFRQHLSLPGLLRLARCPFAALPDPNPRSQIPLVDHWMAGLALFGLKDSSLHSRC